MCTNSRHLLVASGGDVIGFDPQTAVETSIATTDVDILTCRLNDGKCDQAGRYWVGSMSLESGDRGRGSLYSFDARGGVRKVLTNVTASNGMAWSSDGSTMYYIDSAIGTVDAFDYDAESGTIDNRRTTFDVPSALGIADGMTIDANDNLWVAMWGGGCVVCIDPERQTIIERLELPVRHVTSCTFGGPLLRQLYITTAQYGLSAAEKAQQPEAGHLFVAEPGVSGIVPAVFCVDGLGEFDMFKERTYTNRASAFTPES